MYFNTVLIMKIKSIVSLLALAVDMVVHVGTLFVIAFYVCVGKMFISILRLLNKICKLIGIKKTSSE